MVKSKYVKALIAILAFLVINILWIISLSLYANITAGKSTKLSNMSSGIYREYSSSQITGLK